MSPYLIAGKFKEFNTIVLIDRSCIHSVSTHTKVKKNRKLYLYS